MFTCRHGITRTAPNSVLLNSVVPIRSRHRLRRATRFPPVYYARGRVLATCCHVPPGAKSPVTRAAVPHCCSRARKGTVFAVGRATIEPIAVGACRPVGAVAVGARLFPGCSSAWPTARACRKCSPPAPSLPQVKSTGREPILAASAYRGNPGQAERTSPPCRRDRAAFPYSDRDTRSFRPILCRIYPKPALLKAAPIGLP